MPTYTLISGANQGIGLATSRILAGQHGHHVIIGARNAAAGLKVAKELREKGFLASSVQLDLTSKSSIDDAVKSVRKDFGRLDVLINNAGILLDTKDADMRFEDLLDTTFKTNVTGTALLTDACLPLLRQSSVPRVVFVSSRMGSLHQATVRDTPFYAVDYKVYDASKAAVNMLALNYARILETDGGQVNVVCPGLVSTNLTLYSQYGKTPDEGAKRIVELAITDTNGPTGTFSDSDGLIAW